MKKLLLWFALFLSGCVGVPDRVRPVDEFQVEKYLGKWYEIARLDHSFERGLTNVTAEYDVREDGGLRVVNRGYSAQGSKWKEAVGKAYFVNDPHQGFLKVSFFGPFYGSYIVLDLDHEGYQYSLVCGPNTSYLWILSRSPKLDDALINTLVAKAASLGFDTSKLIYITHGLPGGRR
jgi:apolipoprotein D and lipocalin family protein